jgi:hypothetical protein
MRNTCFFRIAMRISLIVFAVGLTFTSCKKDSSSGISANEMSLTISGSTQTLVATTIVTTVNATTGLKLYSTTVTGLSSAVTINIASVSLEKKTYQVLPSVTDIISGVNTGGLIATYTDIVLVGTSTTYSNANLNASGAVTITEVASTYVKGTYDMVLVSSTATTKAIKGEFYCNIVQH